MLHHTFEGQTFSEQVSFPVDSVAFDPDLWLISANNTVTKTLVGTGDLAAVGYALRIEPNPVLGGRIHAVLSAPAPGEMHIRLVVTAEGRTVVSRTENAVTGENRWTFDAAGLAAGVYWLRVENGRGDLATNFLLY